MGDLNSATIAERNLLETARIAHLATADGGSRPHVVPVCFALVGGDIYTPLDEKPKRVEDSQLRRVMDVAANPVVCLLVDRYTENWRRLAWLQVRGRAAIIEPGSEIHADALAALRTRYPQYRSMKLEERSLLVIRPSRLVSWNLNH
jgi:PPOX class probable F420-dependent enzyme